MAEADQRRAPSLSRNPFVLGGLLILFVGIADLIAGYRKVEQYRQELRALPAPPAPDPAELFPKPSANDEREDILRAKLGYYGMLVTTGRILLLLGLASCTLGWVHHRVTRVRLR